MRIVVTRNEAGRDPDYSAQDVDGRELAGFSCTQEWADEDPERLEREIRRLAKTNGCTLILDPMFGADYTLDAYFEKLEDTGA
jgi:hypothetical protein